MVVFGVGSNSKYCGGWCDRKIRGISAGSEFTFAKVSSVMAPPSPRRLMDSGSIQNTGSPWKMFCSSTLSSCVGKTTISCSDTGVDQAQTPHMPLCGSPDVVCGARVVAETPSLRLRRSASVCRLKVTHSTVSIHFQASVEVGLHRRTFWERHNDNVVVAHY